VFPLHHDTAKAIRADLEAIGIPYKTDEGIADFHSLRAYYISALVRSGASISKVHRLARHAKPETTLKYYAKVSKEDLRGAVETLPNPTRTDPAPETFAATGSDGQPISKLVSLHFPYGNDQTSLDTSSPDGMVARNDRPVALTDGIDSSLENKASDDQSRLVAGLEAERGGFEPPKPVSQFNGLANRRYRPLSHLSRSATSSRSRLSPDYQALTELTKRLPGSSMRLPGAGAQVTRISEVPPMVRELSD
jgi:Phage integrase family